MKLHRVLLTAPGSRERLEPASGLGVVADGVDAAAGEQEECAQSSRRAAHPDPPHRAEVGSAVLTLVGTLIPARSSGPEVRTRSACPNSNCLPGKVRTATRILELVGVHHLDVHHRGRVHRQIVQFVIGVGVDIHLRK